METTLLVEAASKAGVSGAAMVDALARGVNYFAAKEPTPEHLRAWIAQLKQDAPHFFALAPAGPTPPGEATPPAWMPPAERMTWDREHHPRPPVQRRSAPYTPTPEQLTSLEGKSATERLTAFREWQTKAQGGPL